MYVEKTPAQDSHAASDAFTHKPGARQASLQRLDSHRPGNVAQGALREMADSSPRGGKARVFQALADTRERAPAPWQAMPADDTLHAQPAANRTGMPDPLKAGLEQLGGVDLSGVRVNYNSARPAQVHALAYAQGRDIHLGPGQERHLPHEGWHVVQQMQGRVRPTRQVADVHINDDHGLEREADVMGTKASAGPTRVESTSPAVQRIPATAVQRMPAAVMQKVNNSWPAPEKDAIAKDNLGVPESAPPETRASAMLASKNDVYRYGREPATDEQVEIVGGASYLKERKRAWREELVARGQPSHVIREHSWEKFQNKVGTLTPGPSDPPWFLDKTWGYTVTQPDNEDWIRVATEGLKNPDRNDPQQVLGQTYARDTDVTSRSKWAGDQRANVLDASTESTFAGKTGWILRLFDNPDPVKATHELRLGLTRVDKVPLTSRFEVEGKVVPTLRFGNGGFTKDAGIRCEQLDGGGISLFNTGSASTTPARTWLNAHWSGKLESSVYYHAVTVAEDSLGIRFQSADPTKARNRKEGRKLDDNAVSELRDRFAKSPHGTVSGNALSLERSLGPARGRINIEGLGWDTASVARYRRLGGDIVFAEADHPVRDLSQYSADVARPADVDVTNADWYHDSQKDRPDRFVGGRSNSTLLYLKTASVLYQQGELTDKECLDVLAFVVADMVVSGEHSLPECMTTVVMAAEHSPPWTHTALNIGGPVAAFKTWMLTIDDGTVQEMREAARAALVAQLGEAEKDYKLLKVLVILGKLLGGTT